MAFEGYMSFKGKNEGQFKGASTKKQGNPSSGHTPILSFSYAVEVPRDVSSGVASGKRIHTPLVITREVDSSSPMLLQACLTHLPFESAELVFSKPGTGKGVVLHNKIELTNGAISDISFAPSKGGKRREAVTLQYEEIRVNGAPGLPFGGSERYWLR